MKTERLSMPSSDLIRLLSGPDRPRTAGLHISSVIRDLLKRMDPKKYPDDSKSPMGLPLWRWEIGFLWEEIWSRAVLRDKGVFTQPELEHEGLLLTPDAVDMSAEELWEFKATWKKACENPADDQDRKFWAWFVQMKAYCYVLGLLQARLVVIFVNGDYRQSGPICGMWRYRFTKAELKENWKMLKDHAKLMREAA